MRVTPRNRRQHPGSADRDRRVGVGSLRPCRGGWKKEKRAVLKRFEKAS